MRIRINILNLLEVVILLNLLVQGEGNEMIIGTTIIEVDKITLQRNLASALSDQQIEEGFCKSN